jgi:hypothetical protein
MPLQPYYEPDAVTPCYKLRYGWAGWPTRGARFPKEMEQYLSVPAAGWEKDGIRLLETDFSPACLLMTFSVKPDVAPTPFTARVKGRLQHALAGAGLRVKFSRKVAMRSIGENHREDVEAYIANQIANESWADPRITELLAPFTVTCRDVRRIRHERRANVGRLALLANKTDSPARQAGGGQAERRARTFR